MGLLDHRLHTLNPQLLMTLIQYNLSISLLSPDLETLLF